MNKDVALNPIAIMIDVENSPPGMAVYAVRLAKQPISSQIGQPALKGSVSVGVNLRSARILQ